MGSAVTTPLPFLSLVICVFAPFLLVSLAGSFIDCVDLFKEPALGFVDFL